MFWKTRLGSAVDSSFYHNTYLDVAIDVCLGKHRGNPAMGQSCVLTLGAVGVYCVTMGAQGHKSRLSFVANADPN
jgi:hypothetical protein